MMQQPLYQQQQPPQYPQQQYQQPQATAVVIHPNVVITQQPMAGQMTNHSTIPTFEHVRTGQWKDDWTDCFNQVSNNNWSQLLMCCFQLLVVGCSFNYIRNHSVHPLAR